MVALTVDEFETLSDFVYRKTGIRFESKKMYFITKRIQKRMEVQGIETVPDYIRLLRFSDPNGIEFQYLTESLTINETYFFRDFCQLQSFSENCLEEVCEAKLRRNDHTFRIWSAACSTGEEPYTLAIIMMEMLEDWRAWDIEIMASDIDRIALGSARRGVYSQRSIRDVPAEYLKRYFINGNGTYQVNNQVKQMVKFEQLNLGDKDALRDHLGFDFVFCRNLMIYFDDKSRKQLVDQFYVSLKSGGYIFLGSSESVGRITTAFRLKRMGNSLVYSKP